MSQPLKINTTFLAGKPHRPGPPTLTPVFTPLSEETDTAVQPYTGPKLFTDFGPHPRAERPEFAQLLARASTAAVTHPPTTTTINKTIKLLITSTGPDTEWERNALAVDVYPYLKQFCRTLGYDFLPLDLSSGLRDSTSANEDHTLHPLILSTLKSTSTTTTSIVIMGNKLSHRPLPTIIEKSEFNRIFQRLGTSNNAERAGDLQLLQEWYRLDMNMRPASYALQGVDVVLPDYRSGEGKEARMAREEWGSVEGRLRRLLVEGSVVLGEEGREKYLRAGVEDVVDVVSGAEKKGMVFVRDFTNKIEVDVDQHPDLAREYCDMVGARLDVDAVERYKSLRHRLTPTSTLQVPWIRGVGFNPLEQPVQADYIREFCDGVCRVVAEGLLKRYESGQLGGDEEGEGESEVELEREGGVEEVLERLRGGDMRNLTQHQEKVLVEACKQNGTAYYAKVAWGVARLWNAYTPPNQTVLPPTVEDLLQQQLLKLEKSYGRVLVSHALSYLAVCAPDGLTEAELIDVLNSDVEVLDEIYKNYSYTSPLRTPPALYLRLISSLTLFLPTSTLFTPINYTTTPTFWFLITTLYLPTPLHKTRTHSTLATNFLTSYPNRPPPPRQRP
ncbi:hypothetical protein HDV00_003732 [Rhizophlyctis rosea]|nr:hypothetical protein HDV00_003732 [Rhizophlyctis rosea]